MVKVRPANSRSSKLKAISRKTKLTPSERLNAALEQAEAEDVLFGNHFFGTKITNPFRRIKINMHRVSLTNNLAELKESNCDTAFKHPKVQEYLRNISQSLHRGRTKALRKRIKTTKTKREIGDITNQFMEELIIGDMQDTGAGVLNQPEYKNLYPTIKFALLPFIKWKEQIKKMTHIEDIEKHITKTSYFYLEKITEKRNIEKLNLFLDSFLSSKELEPVIRRTANANPETIKREINNAYKEKVQGILRQILHEKQIKIEGSVLAQVTQNILRRIFSDKEIQKRKVLFEPRIEQLIIKELSENREIRESQRRKAIVLEKPTISKKVLATPKRLLTKGFNQITIFKLFQKIKTIEWSNLITGLTGKEKKELREIINKLSKQGEIIRNGTSYSLNPDKYKY